MSDKWIIWRAEGCKIKQSPKWNAVMDHPTSKTQILTWKKDINVSWLWQIMFIILYHLSWKHTNSISIYCFKPMCISLLVSKLLPYFTVHLGYAYFKTYRTKVGYGVLNIYTEKPCFHVLSPALISLCASCGRSLKCETKITEKTPGDTSHFHHKCNLLQTIVWYLIKRGETRFVGIDQAIWLVK